MFQFSLNFEKELQEKSPQIIIIIFKIITKVGGEYLIAVPILLVFIFFSFIKSSVFIAGFMICLQFHSMMKIWYGAIRPFWQNTNLYKGICDGGFGNPSGHSMVNTYLYLSLFVYIKEINILQGKYIFQGFILIFFIVWIFSIIFSRIILGMHSLNQVIYGTSLGLIFFLFFIQVFKLHKMPISYYKKFFKKTSYISYIFLIILLLSILSIINKFAFNNNINLEKYNDILNKLCGSDYPNYRRFNNDGLFGSLIIFSILGMYLGQILFWYLIDNKYKRSNNNYKNIDGSINNKNNIKNENNSSLNDIEFDDISNNEYDEDTSINVKNKDNDNEKNMEGLNNNYENRIIDELINDWADYRAYLFYPIKNIFIIILVIFVSLSPGLLLIIVTKNINLAFLFIFKFGIPFFSILFLLYSFGFFYIIKLSCGKKELLLKNLKFKVRN